MNSTSRQHRFVGGDLALDFVNTVAYRFLPEKMEDRLRTRSRVREWFSQAGLVSSTVQKALKRMDNPGLLRMQLVREAIFLVAEAHASGASVPEKSLTVLDTLLRRCLSKRKLQVRGSRIEYGWSSTATATEILLYPILSAAAMLLTSGNEGRLRRCGDPKCGWLFLDRSATGRRRWCIMTDCGNRNKVKEHYDRSKQERKR